MSDKNEVKSSGKYILEEVTTQTARVFKDLSTQEILNVEEMILRIANTVEQMKLQLIG